MNYPPEVWDQVKNKTCDELISALGRDDFKRDSSCKKEYVYRHPDGRRVSIHYHPGKTYGAKLLKALLADIGWTVADLRRVKLIK